MDELPVIVIVFGLPGSGKSYFAERLAKKLNAEYVSSDRLRKALFLSRTYSAAEKKRVYDEMLKKVKEAILVKKKLVLDATFHRAETRNRFMESAKAARLFFVEIRANETVTRERLKKTRPYSEADFEVYLRIRKEWEALRVAHLTLQSTNENIEEMLAKTLDHMKAGQP